MRRGLLATLFGAGLGGCLWFWRRRWRPGKARAVQSEASQTARHARAYYNAAHLSGWDPYLTDKTVALQKASAEEYRLARSLM